MFREAFTSELCRFIGNFSVYKPQNSTPLSANFSRLTGNNCSPKAVIGI